MILGDILRVAPPGTVIPKPEAKADFLVKGVGMRRGERAIIYTIPNQMDPDRPYEKGITVSELERARHELLSSRKLTRQWFVENLPECNKEGSCNFTTIGGLFILLEEAVYQKRGVYVCVRPRY